MDELTTRLAEILQQRFVSLFQMSLKKPLQAAVCKPDEVPFRGPLFHAEIMLLGAGIEGQLLLVADQKFLHETHPERRYGALLEEADYLDWIAELCNRTLAGSKPQIQALGFQLRLQQPRSYKSEPTPVPEGMQESVQVLASEGFHAVLRLRLAQIAAKAMRAL